jgi:1-acyl-sn-glycerol-3-phosphate acyltransferase
MNLRISETLRVPIFFGTVAATATLLGVHTRVIPGARVLHSITTRAKRTAPNSYDDAWLRKRASCAQIFWTDLTFVSAKRILGLSISLDIDEQTERHLRTQPVLVISNHQSFLDVPFIASLLRYHGCTDLRWIIKKEIGRWPFIGYSCRMNGSAFVTRDPAKARSDIRAIIDCAKLAAAERASISIFPEGTRFKTADLASPYQHVLPPHLGAIPMLIKHLPHHVICSLTLHHHANGSGRALIARMRSFSPLEIGRSVDDIEAWLLKEWDLKDAFISAMIERKQSLH